MFLLIVASVAVLLLIELIYLVLNWFLEPYWTASRKNTSRAFPPQEQVYVTASNGASIPFPHLASPATCSLSVIIPAYNEEDRLTIMMEETMPYLESRAEKNP